MLTTSVQPTHGPVPASIGPARGISIKPANPKAGASAVNLVPLCLFGQDSNGRFHGASFLGHDVAAVERAADLMDLYCVAADTDPLRDLATALPTGRLFPNSGKAFVPFIKADLYQRLLAATDTPDEPRPLAAASNPAEAPPPAGAGSGGKGGADAPGGVPKAPPDWASIGIGSTVLACQGPMEGWWEAVVLYTKADDRFVLRWRDFPDEPEIARARKDVALMPPGSREGLG